MSARRLAAALLPEAIAALGELPAERRAEPLRALDAFLASPAPSSYLHAARALRKARRDLRLARLEAQGAARSHLHGLDRLRSVDAPLAGALAAAPVDAASGARLRALAALVEAERELSERVAVQAEALRRQLGELPADDDPKPRRHVSGARRRARR